MSRSLEIVEYGVNKGYWDTGDTMKNLPDTYWIPCRQPLDILQTTIRRGRKLGGFFLFLFGPTKTMSTPISANYGGDESASSE